MKNTSNISLVTGGAGFIGSHLCDALINKDHEVFCVDNLLTGNKKNIAHLLNNPRFHFIQHDIIEPFSSQVENQMPKIKYIYHLASPASPPQYRKYAIETLLVNSVGTCNSLLFAQKYKSRFLLTSTSEVYGDPKEHPQKETYFGNVNPVGLRACYDEAKRFAEALTTEFFRKYSLDVRIVRIFNTYGPRMEKNDGRVVSNFVVQAIKGSPLTVYGDGNQTRSFCFISDMVDGLIKTMEKNDIDGEVINLGNTNEQTILEIANIILSKAHSISKISFEEKRLGDDPQRRKPDISKAKKILNWDPKIPFEKGIEETIAYFRSV